MYLMVSLGFIMSSSDLWRMKKFLNPSLSLIWPRFIKSFPLINDNLDAWEHAWSKYRMQTIRKFPICLWVSGQINSTSDDDVGPEQLLHYGVEGVIGSNENETANTEDPIFCSSSEEVITDGVLSGLQREVSFQSHPEYYGTGRFIKAKTLIKVHYAE